MLDFLIRLYPPITIKEICDGKKIPGPDYVKILPIADEYQAKHVIEECFREIKVSPENVFKVLTYAEQHNPTVHKTCFKVIKEEVPFKTLKEHFEAAPEDAQVRKRLLVKGEFLEFIISNTHAVNVVLLKEVID